MYISSVYGYLNDAPLSMTFDISEEFWHIRTTTGRFWFRPFSKNPRHEAVRHSFRSGGTCIRKLHGVISAQMLWGLSTALHLFHLRALRLIPPSPPPSSRPLHLSTAH